MDFIIWWFVTHWIWATALTPGMTFLYALFTGQTAWAWGAGAWWLIARMARNAASSK